LMADLDQDLVRRINAGDFERCWMAVPELVDWTRIQGFRFGGAKQGALVPDVAFRSFLLEYRDDEIALEQLRSRHVRAIGHDDLEVDHWPVYRCIYSETERGDETFVLSGGRWYQVSTDFVKEVNKAFSKMPGYEHPFPLFLDGSEGAYNQRIASQDAGRYALMDRRLVKAPGMSDSVEFCDLFTTGRDIIHVKQYGASSVLSHLFYQGVVSGELFALDAAFRGAVRGRLPANHRQFVQARDRPAPGAYRVVFAVISGQAGDTLSLPFFSRVAARSAARRLEGLGYLVNLAKIPVDENYAKTRVFKK